MFNDSDNPYAPPVDSSTGHYDWSLAKQAFLACSLIAILYLVAIAVPAWSAYSSMTQSPSRSTSQQIKAFFMDWTTDFRKP